MKRFLIFCLLFLFPFSASAKLKVVATLPVFASLAEAVGGERVEVVSLARGNQDPHFLDAKPAYVVELNKADLLIHGGLELESGWLPPIQTQARNPKILNNARGNVNTAQGLAILEIPSSNFDRSMGDVHPTGNPHTWLDPRNAKIMTTNIYRYLAALDPEGKSYYEGRLKDWLAQLDQKMAQWEAKLQKLRGKKILTYHRSFSYFAHWTGLDVLETIEPKPGIPPSSKHVDHLLKRIPAENVGAIVAESFYPKKVPQYLAEKTKIPFLLLPTNPGEGEIKTYFDLIDHLVNSLEKVF